MAEETGPEKIARDLKAKATLTPDEALTKAGHGTLTTAEAMEMGSVAAAYLAAGMRHIGAKSQISASHLLRVCFDVILADGELARLQWVEGRLAELVKAWGTPTMEGKPTGLDRGLQTAAGELSEVLEASHDSMRPPFPDRTVLVLAIGHEIGSADQAARIQRAVSMAVNHPDWVDSMTGDD
jgi:hypothetical protein